MQTTYGRAEPGTPDGFLKRIVFPEMGWLDQETPDGRTIESAGFGQPYLPATLSFLETTGHGMPGTAIACGRVDEITVHDDGRVSGVGFLEDSPMGARALEAVQRKVVKGCSMELRDVAVKIKVPDWEDYDVDDDGWLTMPERHIRFTKARLGAHTIVATPAFGYASSAVADTDEEIVASFAWWNAEPAAAFVDEVTASAATAITVPWDDFHIPEADKPTKLTVDADGRVFGHIGKFGECHQGVMDRCLMIPRSMNGYAHFNKPGVLTEKGIVNTGPLALYKGHPDQPLDPAKVAEAYNLAENSWADVRVIDGAFGPWASGRVRPGIAFEQVYAARASRVSGHWKGGNLYAVVCVTAEGYDVPAFEFTTDSDGNVLELVASFGMGGCGCDELDTSQLSADLANMVLTD